MSQQIELPFVERLKKNLSSAKPLIQVVQGPRQVGKTTGVLQFLEKSNKNYHYCSADGVFQDYNLWIEEEWQKAIAKKAHFFALDEVQKIQNWSEIIKKIWDKQNRSSDRKINLILLGSSSVLLRKGLSESLAGRYEEINVFHWNFLESRKLISNKRLSLEKYLEVGGYPGAYSKLSQIEEMKEYIKRSIVSPVIEQDILSLNMIKKPSLFKQLFFLLSKHPSQIISYSKLLGSLHDKGNTDLVKSYISIYEESFLFSSIQKYNKSTLSLVKSQPKNFPLAPCFCFLDGDFSEELISRAFEASVGAQLKRIRGAEVFYWNKSSLEIDFVLSMKKNLYAIEVKFGKNKNRKGLHQFIKEFPKAKPVFINRDNYISFLQDTLKFFEET